MKDVLIGGGLIAGGAAVGLGAYLASKRAGERASKAFKDAMDHAKKSETAMRSLNKLRRISKNDVNIGRMNENLQAMGLNDNAFYTPITEYDKVAKRLLARKVDGDLGTVSVGDDARALPIVAHELGHAENRRSGRFRKRLLGHLVGGLVGGASGLAGLGVIHSLNRNHADYASTSLAAIGCVGLGAALGDYITARSIYSEEKEASENAMRYLTAMRRSKDQLARDRKTLDAALNTYETAKVTHPLTALGLAAVIGGGSYLYNKLLS